MNRWVIALLLALVVLAGGCGPEPYVRPASEHEVHMVPYAELERHTGPPPTLVGLPMGLPPNAEPEPQGERPSEKHVWIPGYHRYNSGSWAWTRGGWWVPEGSKNWISGRWVEGPGGVYYWERGHWQ